jgi:5-methylcytosine-specific restriction endonuclease McrA
MLAPVEAAVNPYSMTHLSDELLARDLNTFFTRDHETTAGLLARIAEFNARKLYLPAGYPSMAAYCVQVGGLCPQAAFKRIFAARAALRFPAIFVALAQGRLHLSAVVLLAPHLTEETAAGLLAAAEGKSKSEIERLLAERFPRPDVLTWEVASAPSPPKEQAAELSPGKVDASRIARQGSERPSCKPLSGQSFSVQFTMSQDAHENLRYAQALLDRRVQSGDIGQVIEKALAVFVAHLEKGKFAATTKPRHGHRTSANPRYIPARTKQAVWERDGGQCTFVSEDGHRCPADSGLEFDHIQPVARGGEATVEGIRLLCRAHNQYAAERTFGAEFMHHKHIAAAEARAAIGECAQTAAERAAAAKRAKEKDVVPWLRALGFSAAEAHRAAERCESIDAPLEERVRVALSCFRVRGTHVGRATDA